MYLFYYKNITFCPIDNVILAGLSISSLCIIDFLFIILYQIATMRLFLLFILLFPYAFSWAQQSDYMYEMKKTAARITVDGILSENIWAKSRKMTDFHQKFPNDKVMAESKTEVMMVYNDKYIYIAAICYDDTAGDYIIQSLKRDFSFDVNDAFAVFINPTGDNINGFSFAVNPFNAQREGVLIRGGVFGVSTPWDNIWYSAVTRSEGKWIVEMKIPFTSIRYSQNITNWKVNFARNDLKRNEMSTWSPIPVNQNVANLSYTGDLIWDHEPPSPGLNTAFIPYGTYGASQDYLSGDNDYNPKIGMDGKIAITSNLNLDITVNPDFSQVDVDAQQINLTQFNLFFPEQRKFFIENADLFGQYGFSTIRPFYSRRVGQSSNIRYGARLTGKLDENWRIGVMNIQTGENIREINDTLAIQEENYTIATIQRKIGSASDIGLVFLNQQGVGDEYFNSINRNTIIGAEYNLASKDRTWIGEVFYLYSFQPFQNRNAFTHASFLRYQTRKFNFNWNHEYVGNNFTAVLGFIPRQTWTEYDPLTEQRTLHKHTFWRLEPSAQYFWYPKNKKIFRHGPGVYLSDYRDYEFNPTDIKLSTYYSLNWMSGSIMKIEYAYITKHPLYPFHISGIEYEALPVNIYRYRDLQAEFSSTQRKKLFMNVRVNSGGFYLGTKRSISGSVNYRVQPWGTISANASYNDIELPSPYQSTNLTLYGAKAEVSFTNNIYFTSVLQYNTQADNFNIYNRLQYRFMPMSDLFFVFSDNYDLLLNKKNRTFVIKFVLWLNS